MHISQVWHSWSSIGALWSVPHLFDLYWFPHDMESTVFSVRRTLNLRINSQGSTTLPSDCVAILCLISWTNIDKIQSPKYTNTAQFRYGRYLQLTEYSADNICNRIGK